MITPTKISLKNYSSLRIGGEALLVCVKSEDELLEALRYATSEGLRVYILGEGTNTYFGDDLENLFVIKIEIKGIALKMVTGGHTIKAGAGENWDDCVKFAIKEGLWGIENLSYIPGTIGAAPVQNIGAYGMELKDSFVSLRAYDCNQNAYVEMNSNDCQFGYRDSLFKRNPGRYIIVSVTLLLSDKAKPVLTYKPLDSLIAKTDITLEEIRRLVVQTRTAKLPDYNLYPNTGSFFKNPVVSQEEGETLKQKCPDITLIPYEDRYKISAAWLIEYVGEMKGVRVGNIGTWPNQPLVIVNYADGTAEELNSFVQIVVDKVADATAIVLEREVNFV